MADFAEAFERATWQTLVVWGILALIPLGFLYGVFKAGMRERRLEVARRTGDMSGLTAEDREVPEEPFKLLDSDNKPWWHNK